MSVLDDLLGGRGGWSVADMILDTAENWWERQFTNEEERWMRGTSQPGDTPWGGLGNNTLGGLPTYTYQPGGSMDQQFLGGSISNAPCPGGGGANIPAGTCMTINDVVASGAKGMCYVGQSSGNTPILKKRSRRRRRRMFTASDKNDIQWAQSVAKGPAQFAAIMLRARG